MKSSIPTHFQKSRKGGASEREAAFPHRLACLVILLATWAAFLPTLSNGFVAWDDEETLLANPYFRGFSRDHLAWMFTTFHMGHYQPLSWLSFALDHALWGMNPLGYHLTNLLLHSANAVIFYFIAWRLLRLAVPESGEFHVRPLIMGAACAALFFAIHPLRVESVAWATERRDVLSGLFFLGAICAYLRRQEVVDGRARHRPAAALALYLLSLLSKATAMTLPLVLILLDVYPLRRLGWHPKSWTGPRAREAWREKIPFVFVALAFAAIAFFGQQHAAALKTLESHGIGARLAQALFGAGFYLWKTVLPTGLSPLYEIPPHYGFADVASLISGVLVVAISWALFLVKDRWPAGLACWLYYLVLLAPVLGLAQSGPQLVADRYSYLSCLSWALLGGGMLIAWLRPTGATPRRFPSPAFVISGALTIALGLGFLTWRQSSVWRNTETLWSHVIALDPHGSFGHYNLAREIARQERYQEAMRHYREALRIRPGDVDAHNNLGLLLAITGDFDRSLAELRKAVELEPRYAKGYFNLGRVLARRGDLTGAAENLRKALQLKPDQIEIHLALGALLLRQERSVEAGELFAEAVRIRPDSADAHTALARWFAGQNKKEQAANHYEEALRLIKARAQNPAGRVTAGRNELSGTEKALDSPR